MEDITTEQQQAAGGTEPFDPTTHVWDPPLTPEEAERMARIGRDFRRVIFVPELTGAELREAVRVKIRSAPPNTYVELTAAEAAALRDDPYAGCIVDAATEYAWVIEARAGTVQPRYWTGGGFNQVMFSPDHKLAIRFTRKLDAERVMGTLLNGFACAAVEHAWD